nr:transcription factor E2FA-like isoform X1 [Tanacetum cinerariifolium]
MAPMVVKHNGFGPCVPEWDGVDLLSEEFGLAEVGTPRANTLLSGVPASPVNGSP